MTKRPEDYPYGTPFNPRKEVPYARSSDKPLSQVTKLDIPPGMGSARQREWADGRVDARINPAPIKGLAFRDSIERKKDRVELRDELVRQTRARKPKRKRK